MLAPWKKGYNQPRQHIKKQRLTLPTKVHIVKAMVCPVVMYGCERQRIDAFEKWHWRRLLRVPQTAKRLNQSILKENQPRIFIRRTDAKAETPVLWPPHAKS